MDALVVDFKTRLQKITRDEGLRVILFGSRSRGDHDPFSDYDILVITDRKDSRIQNEIENLEAEIFLETSVLFNSHVFTSEEIERLKYEPFIMSALREGIAA